jgi:guanine deaminase
MKWAIKGDIVYSKNPRELTMIESGVMVCDGHKIIGVFEELPAEFEGIEITDYGNKLIMPGLNDIHVHAPQYRFRASGMDLELLDWLETFTFPEESKFKELDYAKKVYSKFVNDLRKSSTTRASIFATIHVDATIELMDLLEKSGLVTYVGKVNMDRNCPDILTEKNAETSIKNTIEWIERIDGKYENTNPIITPRFIPTCDGELLNRLGEISNSNDIPNQSHLSENPSEIAFVKKLEPESKFYGDAYYMHGLFGGENKTIMAHCVYSGDDEIELMKNQGVYVAHCPASNTNLSSGIAPVRRYLDKGLNIGLGSDVAGGHSLSIFRAMADAIQVSKLRWRLQDNSLNPLKVSEAFYMATKGGGSFFGKVGSFEENYEMDAIVIDDSDLNSLGGYSIENRLERVIYLDSEINIVSKYVRGKKLF